MNFPGGVEYDLIARAETSGLERSGHDAALVAALGEFVNALHRHAQRAVFRARHGDEGVHLLEHRGAEVPRRAIAADGDVVALHAAHGDERRGRDVDFGEKFGELRDDGAVDLLGVADEIHFVHEHRHLTDAEHGEKVPVTAGVFLHAARGVDHHERGLGAGSAGDHVFEKFNVAGRVDDDVPALVRLEEAARRVDRDALILLVVQRVEQEGVLERLRVAAAVFPYGFELALRQRSGVGEETADHGGFAVIDVADGDDIQKLLVFPDVSCFFHYMYPPRRSVSSPPPSSASWARPLRSAMLERAPVRSSSIIS